MGEGGRLRQRRIDACHRRYLAAVKMPATVRRLAVPVLIGQVNIAGQQVNMNIAPSPHVVEDRSSPPPLVT
jgi:hypothetical protein